MRGSSTLSVSDQLKEGARRQEKGDFAGAVACYQKTLRLDPKSFGAYNNLGNIFGSLGDCTTALSFYRAALVLSPREAAVHNNVANICLKQNEITDAILHYSRAVCLEPENSKFRNNFGNALCRHGQLAEAEREFQTAARLDGNCADTYVNLGALYLEQGRVAESEAMFRSAIRFDSKHARAHTNLSYILLLQGNFLDGWREHEWRWKCGDFPSPQRRFSVERWEGQEIRNQTLLVHAEQGFGDTLQFLRYVPLLAAKGIRVVLEVHPELLPITKTLSGVSQLVGRGEPLPEADWHCPLLSLPFVLGTRLETIPASVPYLDARGKPALVAVSDRTAALRVGVVWRSSSGTTTSYNRSIPLVAMQALGELKMLHFSCLQFHPTREELQDCPIHFEDHLNEGDEFLQIAELIHALDLVITVDTVTAHLAGALGKPVWLLLPKVADWRWLMGRHDSPWYPRTKLYRQTDAGDWCSLIHAVAQDLIRAHHSKQMGEGLRALA